jgi:hypothetical protein
MYRFIQKLLLLSLLVAGIQATAQTPVIKVRFANPEYDFATQTYSLDVEFQSNIADQKLYSINVRFYYDDNVLEFMSFGEFLTYYYPSYPNPPQINTSNASSGQTLFGFGGPFEYVNGGVQLSGTTSTTISTTGWTKYFNVSFHVDDPTAPTNDNFCPSVVLDLEEDPAGGGFLQGSAGVVILLVGVAPTPYIPATENVIQYNWIYDGVPGYPYGYPQNITCMSTRAAPIITVDSLLAITNDYVTFSFPVKNFTDISALTFTLDYNPTVLEYCCVVPNSAIASNFSTSVLYPGRIQLNSTSLNATLPNQDTLVHATFKYLGGTSNLAWYDNGTTCQYTNANTGLAMYDSPTSTYYKNGMASNGQYLWIGSSSTDWEIASNWQSSIIPGRFSDVIINSTPMPSYWPTFTGDLCLGNTCGNITLNGTAQLSVTGDLIINPGYALTMIASGLINIGGDWVNSGIFNTGSGTIIFNTTGEGAITEGNDPLSCVVGYVFSNFAPGMVLLSSGLPGPSGDNTHSDVPIGFDFNYLGNDYTQARLNTNGWLSLNLTGPDSTSMNNLKFFNTDQPGTVLAPWWDDLNADGSSQISYLTEGSSPNRVFTAEWKNVLAYSTNATARLNFQVKLYEGTNIIEFCYGDATAGTHSTAESASIGLKDCTGGPGNFIEAKCGTENQTVGCMNSNTNWPVSNYRFTPPIPCSNLLIHRLNVTGDLRVERNITITGLE